MRLPSVKRLTNALLAIGSIIALLEAAHIERTDAGGRKPAQDYVRTFALDVRRPDLARTVDYALTADWTADVVADAALRDVFETVDLSDATPQMRSAWIESARHVNDELSFARNLLLDAIAARPGWPFHQSLLGQIVLASTDPSVEIERDRNPALWSLPLTNAANAAPAVLQVWQALASGYLQNWPSLRPAEAASLQPVLKNAFADPDFVRVTFESTANLIGTTNAVNSLPDAAEPLRVARDYFAARNDIDLCWRLQQRWERAEWRERSADLQTIARHFGRGDFDDVRSLTDQWARRYSVWDFDSPEAHRQAARLLEVRPEGAGGTWKRDAMAEIARYLATRNGDRKQFAPVVARTLDGTASVPAPVLAEARLLDGDAAGAERLAVGADDAGSLQWVPYTLALAREQIARGDWPAAESAMQRLPDAARGTQEAILTRRLLDGRGRVQAPDSAVAPINACGGEGQIVIQGRPDWHAVRVHLTSQQPAIADFGVNGARSASVLVNGAVDVTLRLFGYEEQTFWFRRVSGTSEVCAEVGASR